MGRVSSFEGSREGDILNCCLRERTQTYRETACSQLPIARNSDVVKYNDCLAETTLDLATHLERARRCKGKYEVFKDDPMEGKKNQTAAEKAEQDKKEAKEQESAAQSDASEFVANIREMAGFDDKPRNSSWLSLYEHDRETGKTEYRGDVCLSIEIVPKALAEGDPAGFGRNAPHALPQPVCARDWRKDGLHAQLFANFPTHLASVLTHNRWAG